MNANKIADCLLEKYNRQQAAAELAELRRVNGLLVEALRVAEYSLVNHGIVGMAVEQARAALAEAEKLT